jgi:hypothetical protein
MPATEVRCLQLKWGPMGEEYLGICQVLVIEDLLSLTYKGIVEYVSTSTFISHIPHAPH